MLKPIQDEARVLAQLALEGWGMSYAHPASTLALRYLAKLGGELGKRYENACNYAWATDDFYSRRTEALEDALRGECELLGLFCHLQTDPRGAVLYVSPKPIRPQAYSSQGICIYPAEEV